MSTPVYDVHTHVVPKGWPDLAAECGGTGWPWLRVDNERAAMPHERVGKRQPQP